MNIPTPAQVASARTARLVQEAKTPVYSTSTTPVVRQHITAVEIEDNYGRQWAHMPDNEVEAFMDDSIRDGYDISDVDHSARCWCQD